MWIDKTLKLSLCHVQAPAAKLHVPFSPKLILMTPARASARPHASKDASAIGLRSEGH